MNSHIFPVELQKSFRLINHGPTVLVSASHDGVDNVMAAAWVCTLDYVPPKLTVVLDKAAKTRELIERSSSFAIQVPNVGQLQSTYEVGNRSLFNEPDKLEKSGVDLFRIEGYDPPFVTGCSAWLACRLIPEPRNQEVYDLFIGEIVGAWADTRVFRNGRWDFENAGPEWRSLHYVSGGRFYAIGDPLNAQTGGEDE